MSTQKNSLSTLMFFLHCPRKFTLLLWRIGNRTLTVMTVATEFHRTSPTFCNFLQLTSNIYLLYYKSFKNKNQLIYYYLPEFLDLYSLIMVEINPSAFSGYFSWIISRTVSKIFFSSEILRVSAFLHGIWTNKGSQ